MQGLNANNTLDTLHWQGTIQDGSLRIHDQGQSHILRTFNEFIQARDRNIPRGCGSRLLAAAYAMALYCWNEEATDDSPDLSTNLEDAAHAMFGNTFRSGPPKIVLNHLTSCAESHEHLLTSQELAARVFFEVKRLHQRHRNCLLQLKQHNYSTLCCDQHAEPLLVQHSSVANHTITITGVGYNQDGIYISDEAHVIFGSSSDAEKALIILDNFHIVYDQYADIDAHHQHLPWQAIAHLITPYGVLAPDNWHQLIDWGTQEWQSSII